MSEEETGSDQELQDEAGEDSHKVHIGLQYNKVLHFMINYRFVAFKNFFRLCTVHICTCPFGFYMYININMFRYL